MKVFKYLLPMLLLVTQAYAGAEGTGGGDLCEDRIKIIRDDIQSWIKKGGSAGLKLPVGVSKEQYDQEMLNQISVAKIKCVSDGDEGYPVKYGNTPKVCVYKRNYQGSQITCDFTKFNSTKDSDQYVLIHHEFAGLAKLENPKGDDSNYEISNQISGYLVYETIKKLAVKPQTSQQSAEAPISKMFARQLFADGVPPVPGSNYELNTVYNCTVYYPDNSSGDRYFLKISPYGNSKLYVQNWTMSTDKPYPQTGEMVLKPSELYDGAKTLIGVQYPEDNIRLALRVSVHGNLVGEYSYCPDNEKYTVYPALANTGKACSKAIEYYWCKKFE